MKTFTETLEQLDEIARITFDVSKKASAERISREDIEDDIVIKKGDFYYGYEKDGGDVEAFVGKYNPHRKNEFIKLGTIQLSKVGVNRFTVDISSMAGSARGKGIGKGLYDFILTDLKYILVSGSSQSIGGRKAWKYLAGNKKYIVWAQQTLKASKKEHIDISPDGFEVDASGFTVYGDDDEIQQLEQDHVDATRGLEKLQSSMSKSEFNKRMKATNNAYEKEIKDAQKGEDAYLFAVAKKHFRK